MFRKHLQAFTFCCAVAFTTNALCADYAIDPAFKKSWSELTDICSEATPYLLDDYRDGKSALEFITFRESKYVRLLKEAQNVLGVSEITPRLDDINRLRFKNKALREDIVALKLDRITGPDSSYNPLTSTKKSIDKSIASKNEKITENETAIDKIKRDILNKLGEHGLNLSDRELDYFLISTEGDELIL